MIQSEIACAIIEGISSVREDEELQDFVVEVEGKEFKCHRLILSACSGFFRGLFRSGMKESLENKAKIEGINNETFAVILETIYNGSNNLTHDNMLNVWLAADQLQITAVFNTCVDFITKNFSILSFKTVISVWEVALQLRHENIIALCETFIRKNIYLQNCTTIYSTAKSLHSEVVLSHVLDFIKTNYEQVSKSNSFFFLSEKHLLEIIESPDLIISCEDSVIESILSWVKSRNTFETVSEELYDNASSSFVREVMDEKLDANQVMLEDQEIDESTENFSIKVKYSKEDSMKCVERLLLKVRLCLVSSTTIEKISRETLIMDNKKTREMIIDAALYSSIGRQHGILLTAGIHRRCSDLENVGVIGHSNGRFKVLSHHNEAKWFFLPDCPYLPICKSVKLIAYMTDFFVVGDLGENSSLCLFVQGQWREVKKLPGKGWLSVAVEEYIYLFKSYNQQIKRFNPRLWKCHLVDFIKFPTYRIIEFVCSFELFILVFCSEFVNSMDETAVHCLDIRSQTWSRLDNLEGEAENMVSFRKEKQLFILQTNGNLWEIYEDTCKRLCLKLVEVLWDKHVECYGAICNTNTLFVAAAANSFLNCQPSSKLFLRVNFVKSPKNVSNIVPAVIKKSVFR